MEYILNDAGLNALGITVTIDKNGWNSNEQSKIRIL